MRAAILLVLVLMMAVWGAAQAPGRADTGITVIPSSMTSDPGIDFHGSDVVLLANAIMRKARDTNTLYPAYTMPLYDDRTTKVITATQTFELLARTLISWYENGVCPDKVTIAMPNIGPPALQPLLEPPTDGDTHAVRTEEIYACASKMLVIISKMKTLSDSFTLGKTAQTQYKFTTAQMIVAMAAVLQDADEALELPRTVETPLVRSPKIWNALDSPLPIKRVHSYKIAVPLPPMPPPILLKREPVSPATDANLPDLKVGPKAMAPPATTAVTTHVQLSSVYPLLPYSPAFFAKDATDIARNDAPRHYYQKLDYADISLPHRAPATKIKLSVTPHFFPLWHPTVLASTADLTPGNPVVQSSPVRGNSAQVNPASADILVLLNGMEVTMTELEGSWLSEVYSGKISVIIRPQGDLQLGQIRIDNSLWLVTSGNEELMAEYNTQVINDGWHSMAMSAIDKSGRGIIHTINFQVRNGKMSGHITKPEVIDDGS